MQKLLLNNVKKLSRHDNNSLFIYFATNTELKEWNLRNSNNPIYNLDGVIYIHCNDLIELDSIDEEINIEITDPEIISMITEDFIDKKYLVIITKENLPHLIYDMFLNDDKLKKLIEVKGLSVSKRSTKVITNISLKKLIHNVFANNISKDSAIMVPILKEYMNEFLRLNKIYYPKSVKDMVEIKENYVLHQVNIWFIILNYFKEQWESNNSSLNVPLFSTEIEYKNWKGNFFSRENPLWEEINKDTGRSHYPSEESNKIIFKYWKELAKPS